MSKVFYSSRSSARATGHSVKDAGVSAPKGKRWYIGEDAKVSELLIKAKQFLLQEGEIRKFGKGQKVPFICHAIKTADGCWNELRGEQSELCKIAVKAVLTMCQGSIYENLPEKLGACVPQNDINNAGRHRMLDYLIAEFQAYGK